MPDRRTHIIHPEVFVRYGRESAWCGTFGSHYSPLVEHPDDADCEKCLRFYAAWEARQTVG